MSPTEKGKGLRVQGKSVTEEDGLLGLVGGGRKKSQEKVYDSERVRRYPDCFRRCFHFVLNVKRRNKM